MYYWTLKGIWAKFSVPVLASILILGSSGLIQPASGQTPGNGPVDSDGDGVIDLLDKCSGTPPETPVDDDGCPDTSGDTISPIITLVGDATVILLVGETYTDAGATALDDVNEDLTGAIVTVNPVDTSIAATYIVTYNVSDSAGNAATQVIRTVIVLSPAQAIQNLIDDVAGFSLDVQDRLIHRLFHALEKITDVNDDNDLAACGKLRGFIHHVDHALEHKSLTTAEADDLIQKAERIRTSIGCPKHHHDVIDTTSPEVTFRVEVVPEFRGKFGVDDAVFRFIEVQVVDDIDHHPIVGDVTLNGVVLQPGDLLRLELDDEFEVEEDDEFALRMEAPEFIFSVFASDHSGNSVTAQSAILVEDMAGAGLDVDEVVPATENQRGTPVDDDAQEEFDENVEDLLDDGFVNPSGIISAIEHH